MKKILLIICLTGIANHIACAQTMDTLVDAGGYHLHFHIIKGNGTPILFESGGGDDCTVWKDILKPLSDITGTTLITYEREGFGKSELDTTKHDIVDAVQGLETALKNLGYSGNLMLVAHSLGGFYATLFAARNPQRVKSAVLFDINLIGYFNGPKDDANDSNIKKTLIQAKKDKNWGIYYMYADIPNTMSVMKKTIFPVTIPLIDIVAEQPADDDPAKAKLWVDCHRKFVEAAPNRTGITAYAAGHYVYMDNPTLAIDAIVKEYAATINEQSVKDQLWAKAFQFNFESANDSKKTEEAYRHSEDNLNAWGYDLLTKGKKKEAVAAFKLNVQLHPKSANAYDSLAEAYEAVGNKQLAIQNYQHSLKLDPGNDHAIERLRILKERP